MCVRTACVGVRIGPLGTPHPTAVLGGGTLCPTGSVGHVTGGGVRREGKGKEQHKMRHHRRQVALEQAQAREGANAATCFAEHPLSLSVADAEDDRALREVARWAEAWGWATGSQTPALAFKCGGTVAGRDRRPRCLISWFMTEYVSTTGTANGSWPQWPSTGGVMTRVRWPRGCCTSGSVWRPTHLVGQGSVVPARHRPPTGAGESAGGRTQTAAPTMASRRTGATAHCFWGFTCGLVFLGGKATRTTSPLPGGRSELIRRVCTGTTKRASGACVLWHLVSHRVAVLAGRLRVCHKLRRRHQPRARVRAGCGCTSQSNGGVCAGRVVILFRLVTRCRCVACEG